MRKDRIALIADRMEGVRPRAYQQTVWAMDVSSRKAEFKEMPDGSFHIIAKEGFCGSAGCVLGHGGTVPGTGLALMATADEVDIVNGRRFATEVYVVAEDDLHLPEDDRATGYEAAAHALEIELEHAEIMFGGGNDKTRIFYSGEDDLGNVDPRSPFHEYITPKMVAAALRKYIDTNGKSIELAVNYGFSKRNDLGVNL